MSEEPRVGVFVCHCGLNIAGTVDVKEVTDYARTLPNVVIAMDNRYTCADPGTGGNQESHQRAQPQQGCCCCVFAQNA